MSVQLSALVVDAHDPPVLARFWAGLLDGRIDGTTVATAEDTGFALRFVPATAPKVVANRMHLDLTSTSLADQAATVERAVGLGARPIDVGQRPEEGHVVLADPEGNEFCVVGPGNAFLAGCGFLGAIACDGSRQVGRFWSAALGWPLVWDQDEETAIRAPHGGPKISWGGPPLPPRTGPDRVRFEVTAADPATAADRLLALGAERTEGEEPSVLVLTDPDGNEFSLRAPA